VLAARLQGADAKTLRDTLDKLKDKLKTAAIVLAAVEGGKVQLAAGVTADSMGKGQGRRAGQLRRPAGGRQGRRQARHGDGRRHRPVARWPQALASVAGWVGERV
jgi:alanyl-tRNA synthetase